MLQRLEAPCSLGLFCSSCGKEILPVAEGMFCDEFQILKLVPVGSHLNSLFRRVVSCYWWVWTLQRYEENQMCFCSEAVFLPVWRTSAVGAWRRRLPAARTKSRVTERLKNRSAAHLWPRLNWWVRICYPTVSNVSLWSKQVGVKQ